MQGGEKGKMIHYILYMTILSTEVFLIGLYIFKLIKCDIPRDMCKYLHIIYRDAEKISNTLPSMDKNC